MDYGDVREAKRMKAIEFEREACEPGKHELTREMAYNPDENRTISWRECETCGFTRQEIVEHGGVNHL